VTPVAITTTPKLGLPQWSLGSDSPSRTAFNAAFAAIDAKVALDLGEVGATTLPGSDVVAGRYAQTVNGNYRQLYRRDTAGWKLVGGNHWSETFYNRADGALATSAAARIVSHPSLSNPGVTENWDGSSIRGARQAIGDVNAAQPGALHVGDTASAVDLAVRGRVYARTTADGQRGFVASAHGSGAGHLYAAVEPGGTVPWYVDATGRMRAQAPAGFGAASPTTNVPLAVSPGASDTSAVDLYATSGKPALRLFRGAGDQIGSVLPDAIALGKGGWSGGSITLTAPTLALIGAAAVTGALSTSGQATLASAQITGAATVGGSLGVSGTATLAAVNATSVTASGNVAGSGVTATNALSAHGGLVASSTSGSGALLSTRPPTQVSGSASQSVRASTVAMRTVTPNVVVSVDEATRDVTFVMPEDGWLRVDAEIDLAADLGEGGTYELFQTLWQLDLRSGGSTLGTGVGQWVNITTDDSARQIPGRATARLTEVFTTRITAGSYTLRITYQRGTLLAGTWLRGRFWFTPIVLHSTS
jgi:hypothetical protein